MAVADIIQNYLLSFVNERDEADYLARVSDDSWQIIFSNDLTVLVTLAQEIATIGLTGLLGKPSPERRLEVYGALLSYSTLWRETGGLRGALDDDGEVLLVGELALGDITEADLHGAIDALREVATGFAEFVTSMNAPAPGSDSDVMMVRI